MEMSWVNVNTEPIPLGSGINSALGVYVIAGSRGFPGNTIQYVPFIITAVPQEKMSTHFCWRELKQMFNVINNCQASAPTEMFNSEAPRDQIGAGAPTWGALAGTSSIPIRKSILSHQSAPHPSQEPRPHQTPKFCPKFRSTPEICHKTRIRSMIMVFFGIPE